jgi:hypothetical protein
MQIYLYTKNFIRQYTGWTIPTPVILCFAAILGCISIMLAFKNTHPVNNGGQKASSQVIIIIPTNAQKQVALSLPE